MARVFFLYLPIFIHENCLLQIKTYGVSPITDDHDDLWGVPSLNELGFDTGKKLFNLVQTCSNWYKLEILKVKSPEPEI